MLTNEKNQAPASPSLKLAKLGIEDLEAVYTLECAAFPKPMQASRETIATRFELGHFMFGIWELERLVGLASWRRAWFDPEDRSIFPETFSEYSGAPNSSPYNAAFVYNLCIHPEKRGTALARILIKSIIKNAESDYCRYLVGDGRCPSYNGSDETTEKISLNTVFRGSIDRELQVGQRPSLSDYLSDPLLCFYHRTLGCQFLWTIPNFLPADSASGGHQVIFYNVLNAPA